jgi:hypothetical protein
VLLLLREARASGGTATKLRPPFAGEERREAVERERERKSERAREREREREREKAGETDRGRERDRDRDRQRERERERERERDSSQEGSTAARYNEVSRAFTSVDRLAQLERGT